MVINAVGRTLAGQKSRYGEPARRISPADGLWRGCRYAASRRKSGLNRSEQFERFVENFPAVGNKPLTVLTDDVHLVLAAFLTGLDDVFEGMGFCHFRREL
jgi:hypothetical protein